MLQVSKIPTQKVFAIHLNRPKIFRTLSMQQMKRRAGDHPFSSHTLSSYPRCPCQKFQRRDRKSPRFCSDAHALQAALATWRCPLDADMKQRWRALWMSEWMVSVVVVVEYRQQLNLEQEQVYGTWGGRVMLPGGADRNAVKAWSASFKWAWSY